MPESVLYVDAAAAASCVIRLIFVFLALGPARFVRPIFENKRVWGCRVYVGVNTKNALSERNFVFFSLIFEKMFYFFN